MTIPNPENPPPPKPEKVPSVPAPADPPSDFVIRQDTRYARGGNSARPAKISKDPRRRSALRIVLTVLASVIGGFVLVILGLVALIYIVCSGF